MVGGPAFPPGGSAEVGQVDERQLFYAVGMAGETPVVLASHASEEEAVRLGEAAAGGGKGVTLVRAVPAEGEDDAVQQYMYGMDGASELTMAVPPPTSTSG